MDVKEDNSQRSVLCSFCEEQILPSEVGQHLMMCGNKTDQCPNCRKFIRRAIFAYHFENNCANLDETHDDASTATNQPNSSSTFQPNYSSQPSSELTAEDNKQVSMMTVHLRTNSTANGSTSQQSDSAFCETKLVTIRCRFCNEHCALADRNVHQENCVRNPTNIEKRQRPLFNGTANQSFERLQYANQSDDTTAIPCEYCKKPIEWRHFEEHTRVCVGQGQERRPYHSRPINENNNNLTTQCKHCGEERTSIGLRFHELICKAHPRWSAGDKPYRTTLRLPSLSKFLRPSQ